MKSDFYHEIIVKKLHFSEILKLIIISQIKNKKLYL